MSLFRRSPVNGAGAPADFDGAPLSTRQPPLPDPTLSPSQQQQQRRTHSRTSPASSAATMFTSSSPSSPTAARRHPAHGTKSTAGGGMLSSLKNTLKLPLPDALAAFVVSPSSPGNEFDYYYRYADDDDEHAHLRPALQLPVVPHVYEQLKHLLISAGTGSKHDVELKRPMAKMEPYDDRGMALESVLQLLVAAFDRARGTSAAAAAAAASLIASAASAAAAAAAASAARDDVAHVHDALVWALTRHRPEIAPGGPASAGTQLSFVASDCCDPGSTSSVSNGTKQRDKTTTMSMRYRTPDARTQLLLSTFLLLRNNSKNGTLLPGMTGTPYARVVPNEHPIPYDLAEPGVVFDALLAASASKQSRLPPPTTTATATTAQQQQQTTTQQQQEENGKGLASSLMTSLITLAAHSVCHTGKPLVARTTSTPDGGAQQQQQQQSGAGAGVHLNRSSAYFDLSPLYGDTLDELDKVRNKSLGLGLLHPDTFASRRVLGVVPPSVAALLVLFSRNHNWLARRVCALNERRDLISDPHAALAAFSDVAFDELRAPQAAAEHVEGEDKNKDKEKEQHKEKEKPKATEEDIRERDKLLRRLAEQDEYLFNVARALNCAWFARVIQHDVVRAFTTLSPSTASSIDAPALSSFALDTMGPEKPVPAAGRKSSRGTSTNARGTGNAISLETNLVLRAAAFAFSDDDTHWLEQRVRLAAQLARSRQKTPEEQARQAERDGEQSAKAAEQMPFATAESGAEAAKEAGAPSPPPEGAESSGAGKKAGSKQRGGPNGGGGGTDAAAEEQQRKRDKKKMRAWLHREEERREKKLREGDVEQLLLKPFDQLTMDDFEHVKAQYRPQENEPREWTFNELKRTPANKFDDAQLAQILSRATASPAGAYGARSVPDVLKAVYVATIELARHEWKVCTMNEYRRHLGLREFGSFEEWNSDKEVARAAERIYGHIDNLELFVGLVAEQVKPFSGAGLAQPYTLQYALVCDLLSLIRGDRFLTTELTTDSLTRWGLQDVKQPDPYGASFGGMLDRLLHRTLPNSYKYNSVYASFPLVQSKLMGEVLLDMGLQGEYDTSMPKPGPKWYAIRGAKSCRHALEDADHFAPLVANPLEEFTDMPFFLSSATNADFDQRQAHYNAVKSALFASEATAIDKIKHWFSTKTQGLIESSSFSVTGGVRQFDVVAVTSAALCEWVAETFAIPVSATRELLNALETGFTHCFTRETSVAHKRGTKRFATALREVLAYRLREAAGALSPGERLIHTAAEIAPFFTHAEVKMADDGDAMRMYRALLQSSSDRSFDALATAIEGILAEVIAEQGKAIVNIVNLFFEEQHASQLERITKLSKSHGGQHKQHEVDYELNLLAMEALRLDPPDSIVPRISRKSGTVINDGSSRRITLERGDVLLCDVRDAYHDPQLYAEPLEFRLDRQYKFYKVFAADNAHIGAKIASASLVSMMRQIFKLPNIRRAPGNAGQLCRFPVEIYGVRVPVYLDHQYNVSPFPVGMKLEYDTFATAP